MKMTSKITQGRCYWCHSIHHLCDWFPVSLPLWLSFYLVPFRRYCHSFAKN